MRTEPSWLQHRAPAAARGLTLMAIGALACAACILPDVVGVADEDDTNRHAVRIVEPSVLTAAVEDQCLAECPECGGCPQPPPAPEAVLPHFLDPSIADYNFCSCPEGQLDQRAQNSWTLYVEDRDGNDNQLDDVYVALQLDYEPGNPNPQNFIAYRAYMDPSTRIGDPLSPTPDIDPIKRPYPRYRVIQFGNSSTNNRFDFCNGAGVGGESLSEGYHTLRVLVTDRPWFTAPGDGPDADTDDPNAISQEGVPDLAAGATYDVATYVFHCQDEGAENADCDCDEGEV